MNINQAGRLLNEANRKTICNTNSLEEFRGQAENYYKLEKKGEEWSFVFVACERNSKGIEETIKTFENESEASIFYYLYELSKWYRQQYIHPFIRKHKDLNIGRQECKVSEVKEAFNRLGIQENYYNFKNVENEHSICLKEIGNGKSRFSFIGNKIWQFRQA